MTSPHFPFEETGSLVGVGVAVVEQEVELGRTMAVEKEDEGWTGVGVMVETG